MITQSPLNQWEGITLNIVREEFEQKYIVKENASLSDAWDIARQCRLTHPEEPIEIIPRDHGNGLVFTVYRIVKDVVKL